MAESRLIIGSRGSELALVQANLVRNAIEASADCRAEIKVIKTQGDRIDHLSFDKMEGKGFFTKELELALLDRSIDLAVHSLKDLPTRQPDRLKIGAVGFRADRRELVLIRPEACQGSGIIPVKEEGVIGTSSPRRKCQIARHNPGLKIKDLRGNVPTRVQKLREGQYDAILIAVAGIDRLELDLADLIVKRLDPTLFLPAPGQGILALQTRIDNDEVNATIARLNDQTASAEAALERGLLAKFDSGCSLPLGVYSEVNGAEFRLLAVLGEPGNEESGRVRRIDVSGRDIDRLVLTAFTALNMDPREAQ